ncbi:MAG TPA: hypothetical protein DCR14_07255, partial [Acidimicrobiaceae bacterium]|nr:hypothetical protein [Acidimicrobiaceae bacterium]
MTVLAHTRRKRTAIMLAVNLLSVLALGGIGYAGYKALRRYEGGTRVSTETTKLPYTPVGMLATVDNDDQLTSVVVVVLQDGTAGFRGGSLVPVPISADTALGVDGLRVPLTEVYAAQGDESLAFAVESAVGITLDHWLVVTPDELEVLLAPLAPLAVELPVDIYDGPADDPTLVREAGAGELSAEQWAEVLNARLEGQKERARRQVVEGLWSSVAAAAGGGAVSVADIALPLSPDERPVVVDSMSGLFDRLLAGPAQSRGIAAAPLPAEEVPPGVDVEQLDFADAVMVFGSIAPSATTAPRPSLVYRIEAPPGYDDRVKWAVELVLFLGGNVQSVKISADVPERSATEFVMYASASRDDLEAANDVFGSYRFVEPDERIEGVEVVSKKFLRFLGSMRPPSKPRSF